MDCNEISCLTLKTKEIALDVKGTNLWVDFARILKCKDDVYINATQVVKDYKGGHVRIEDYLKREQTKKYQKALEDVFLIVANPPQLESENSKTILKKHGFVFRRKGRYGGTWLHRKMFLNFARWLSPEFEVLCDQIIEQVIVQADELRESRLILRELQKPLNDVIKTYLVDTGIKEAPSAYIQFAVMIKRMIGQTDERDYYTKTQLNTARLIIEEYRAMIVHGGKTSLKEMNTYLHGTDLNLAWKKDE